MNANFLTHLDDLPRRSRAASANRASVRATLLEGARARALDFHPNLRSLLDPTVLEGATVENVHFTTGRLVLDLLLLATTDDPEGPRLWGGPMRLIAETDVEWSCSDRESDDPDPDDPIIWSELRLQPGHDHAELVLVCASDRRWRLSAGTIRFATLPIPS